MKYKHERIERLIRNEVMSLITGKKLKDPRIPELIVITQIKISKDFHYCQILFSAYGNPQNKILIQDALNNARGFIQKHLAGKLQLRFTPKLDFQYDLTEEKAYQVDDLLDSLAKKREENKSELDK